MEVGRPCWKHIMSEKDNRIKISDTLLGWGLERQKTQSGSSEPPGETEPFGNINHAKPKGNQCVECCSLPGRVGREEENANRHLRGEYAIAKQTY